MRTLSGVTAILLGAVGVLLCTSAIGLGWWLAVKTADRITRVADRLDQGLVEADAGLARAEERMAAVHAGLDQVRVEAERIDAENQDAPRVRAAVERVLDRFTPVLDRADAIADSLRPVAAGLRTTADIVTQLDGDPELAGGVRRAADSLDAATAALDVLRAKVGVVKSIAALHVTRELVELVREAVAGSERLAQGLTAARRELAVLRTRTAEARDRVVFWTYAAAAVNTAVWAWAGAGQLCLLGWGRRRLRKPEGSAA